MKKAYLVSYHIMTRVAIDATGDAGADALAAHLKAKEQLKAEGLQELMDNRFIYDNAETEEDEECPYGSMHDEEEDETQYIYQPETPSGELPEDLFSFEVYRDEETAAKDYPGHTIKKYHISEIEEPAFID